MIEPDYGVIVGRFQVNALHDGHLDLFDQVQARHKSVIVFVGISPGGISQKHPLDFPARKAMIQASFPNFIVLPLKDARTDDIWSEKLDAAISDVVPFGRVTLYGGRDSFVPHYHGRHQVVELALDPRKHKISGADVRLEVSNTIIQSPDFRAGMIYAMHHLFPIVLPCVDIAVMHWGGSEPDGFTAELLLAQRGDETQWRFIGGHAEGLRRPTYEQDAKSETLEEGGVDLTSLEYIGSTTIDDWRYANCPDRIIKTAFFLGTSMTLGAIGGDDVKRVKWFKIGDLNDSLFVPEHRVLYHMLVEYLKKTDSTI
jgi:bifunctional NMN adenylyltransferase/nudix hydrolase